MKRNGMTQVNSSGMEISGVRFFGICLEVLLLAILLASPIMFIGCGGGGPQMAQTSQGPRDASKKVIEVTVHEDGYRPFYPEDIWGAPMSGWAWSLYDYPESASHTLMNASSYNEPYCPEDSNILDDNLLSPCWHVTHGFFLDSFGLANGNYVERFNAKLRWVGSVYDGIEIATSTEVILNISLVPDDTAERISVIPEVEEQLSCWDYSAFKFNVPSNTSPYAIELYPTENYQTRINLVAGKDPVDGSLIVIPQTRSGYLKPGEYILALRYSTAWETGDYTMGEKTFSYTVKDDYFYCEQLNDDGSWSMLGRAAGRSSQEQMDRYPGVVFTADLANVFPETERQKMARNFMVDAAHKR